MRFKNEENMNYAIDVNDDDTVNLVKIELSKCILVNSNDIILVYQNKTLDDTKIIKEYNIASDEFVLFYLRNDYIAGVLNVVSKSLSEKNSTFIDLMTKFMRQNILKIIRYKRKSISGVDIYLIFECVNVKTKSITWKLRSGLIMEEVKEFISQEIDIPSKNIGCFKDRDLHESIHSIDAIDQVCKSIPSRSVDKINIYYQIIADFDCLIKNESLGRGAFGKTFKCTEIGTNRKFALKKFDISQHRTKQYETLNNAIDVLCAVGSHPGILRFEKKFRKKNALYIQMEYMAGGSLRNRINLYGPLVEKEISKFSQQILEAMEYLHGNGIVHGNIKGNNILLDKAGNAKLSDYGLTILLIEIASGDLLNGAVQSSLGTVNWMSPEFLGGEEYSIRSDIWSFGATLVEMVTGHPPFHGWTMYRILNEICIEKKIVYDQPESMSDCLKDFIDLCVHPDPSERPNTKELLKHGFVIKYRFRLQYNCKLQ